MEEPSVDLDDVEPRLYLIGPKNHPTGSLLKMLSVVLDVIHPVAFLLPKDAVENKGAAALRALCADRGTAFFVQDNPDLAKTLAADGLHQCAPDTIKQLRATIDRDRILGVDAGRSRHIAIDAGEDGADYLAFGILGQSADQEIIELVSWWRDLFVLPCLAYAETQEEARGLAEAGADFIGVSSGVWNHLDGPAKGALHMQAAIEKT